MKISKGSVVHFDFTLTDNEGDTIDASDGDPLVYLHGYGQLVPGLERALEGREVGANLEVEVSPNDGYGDYSPERVITLARTELPTDLTPEVGMELDTEGPDGDPITLWITDVDDTNVTLDGNHPLAGQTLRFVVDVRKVRAATADELSHGHAHGPGSGQEH